MNLSKFKFGYEKYGFTGFVNVLLGKIGSKYRIQSELKRMIIWHGKNIAQMCKNRIISGYYKGVKIEINSNWNTTDAASKYLGLYELEVQKNIINLQKKKKFKKKFLINLGAGEGYHPISLLKKKIFNNAILYETDKNGQDLIKRNSKTNKISNKIKILGEAKVDFLDDHHFMKLNLKNCFFLLDIESDEFKLLNKENIFKLRKSNLLIEIHPMYLKNGKRQNKIILINKLKKFFKIEILTTKSRDLSGYKFLDNLSDLEKSILVSEGRPEKMEWLSCVPK
tara:strand:- start:96 stop:938 length:843 start_codon:yes stop_codon:yes gene_type:complete